MENLLHTPEGVRDIYNGECEKKNILSHTLNDVLRLYGYKDIQTPTFEFFDIFNTERGTVSSKNMYKFFDREGNTLVLRPDITPSIARAVAKYFKDACVPLRFSYMGNTFINNSSLQGRMKESTQLGGELVGDNSIEADAEILALVINLLLKSGLTEFQLDIGHVGVFEALVEEAGMEKGMVSELRLLIESKNYFGVENLVSELPVSDELREIILKLPELFGSVDVLATAKALTHNARAFAAIERLEQLYNLMKDYGFEKYITIDLGMLSTYDYYSGIIFRGYTYGTGDAVVKGGRYDHLIEQFGKPSPSIGFAIVIDELMIALSRQKIDIPVKDKVTMVLYEKDCRQEAIALANALRSSRMRVCMNKRQVNLEAYRAYCRQSNIDSMLYLDNTAEIKRLMPDTEEVTRIPMSDFI